MKIKEAIEIINGTTSTVLAKESNGFLHMYRRDFKVYANWFLEMPIDATNWDSICSDWYYLSNIEPQDLARVMDVIQRLLDTPVEERFLEKSYRLVAKRKPDRSGLPKYVKAMATGFDEFNFYLTDDKNEAEIYKESLLEGIKEREPSLAPAIDAMKEETKEYDRS